jgi:2-keto-4-pentenoate hydratase/2-oxohepta-3-ene-1,7-dioic acid hydratase in catechol pathway
MTVLCMFTPKDMELERGWPGRIDGDRVVQLAAQTLQAFFTGGGGAREHANHALEDVLLRAPVLHPPSIRIFGRDGDFMFASPEAIHGPEDVVHLPEGVASIVPVLRIAAIVGAGGAVGGYTLMNDWEAPELSGAKATDFATSLGPIVVTPDEFEPPDVDFPALFAYACRNTRLAPGDVIVAPGGHRKPAVEPGETAEVSLEPFGTLRNRVAQRGAATS